MSSVGCPRCEESFRVPDASLPPDISLRCPWCMETFSLSEISQRLLPMVELIGDDGQVIELNSLVSLAAPAIAGVAAATPSYRETLPAYEPISRIEPAVQNQEDFGYSDDEPLETSLDADSFDAMQTISTGEDLLSTIENDAKLLDMEQVGFDSDQFESVGDQPDEQFVDDQYEATEDDDPYQTFIDQGDRTPISGPVAPRPMSRVEPVEFSHASLKSKPRKKKSGSPLKTAFGVIFGSIMSVPLAIGVLYGLSQLGVKVNLGFWPLDGTTSTVVKSNRPLDLNDDRGPKAIATEKPLTDDLGPNSFGLGNSESTETTESTIEEPLSPLSNTAAEPLPAMPVPAMPENVANEALPGQDVATKELVPEPLPTTNESPEPSIANIVSEPKTEPTPAFTMPADADVKQLVPITEPKPELSVSFDPLAPADLLAAIEQTDNALRSLVEITDPANKTGLMTGKFNFYNAILNVALTPQSLQQSETTALLDRIANAGLMNEMTSKAPKWLGRKRSSDGIFATGKAVKKDGQWVLQWNDGMELQLQNLNHEAIKDGEEIVILGKIVDASPPAIISVTYYNQPAKH